MTDFKRKTGFPQFPRGPSQDPLQKLIVSNLSNTLSFTRNLYSNINTVNLKKSSDLKEHIKQQQELKRTNQHIKDLKLPFNLMDKASKTQRVSNQAWAHKQNLNQSLNDLLIKTQTSFAFDRNSKDYE